MLGAIGRPLDTVLFFDLDDETATVRALGRAHEEGRRDDTPEVMARRLAIYHEQTEPVVERYRAAGTLRTIDAASKRRRRLRPDRGGNPPVIIRKGPEEIERIARAGDLVAATIAHVGEHIEPGITTGELDDIAGAFIAEHGGASASKGYHGTYPAEICISPNSMVVHGIPGPYRVAEGDLITIDVGVVLDGAIADSAYTYGVGSIDSEAQRLLDVCQDALAAGIAEARLGNRIGDISHAVQTIVEGAGFSVVRSLVGHGVGRYYHEAPHVPNFGRPGRGERLSEGMTIAIEPMITVGSPEVVRPRRRLVDLDRGRVARRAFRAHGRDYRRRAADSDPRVGIAVERASLLQ